MKTKLYLKEYLVYKSLIETTVLTYWFTVIIPLRISTGHLTLSTWVWIPPRAFNRFEIEIISATSVCACSKVWMFVCMENKLYRKVKVQVYSLMSTHVLSLPRHGAFFYNVFVMFILSISAYEMYLYLHKMTATICQ